MSTLEDVWRRKTDFDLKAAVSRLNEYTDEGQRVIVAELHRRRLEANSSANVTSAGAPDHGVLAPGDRIKEGWTWIAVGTIITVGTYIVGSSIRAGYLIAWGPIVYGLRQLWRGQMTSSSGRHEQAPIDLPPVTEVRCWSCKQPLPVTQATRGTKVACARCGTKQRLPR
jgi:hypothetical protein